MISGSLIIFSMGGADMMDNYYADTVLADVEDNGYVNNYDVLIHSDQVSSLG